MEERGHEVETGANTNPQISSFTMGSGASFLRFPEATQAQAPKFMIRTGH